MGLNAEMDPVTREAFTNLKDFLTNRLAQLDSFNLVQQSLMVSAVTRADLTEHVKQIDERIGNAATRVERVLLAQMAAMDRAVTKSDEANERRFCENERAHQALAKQVVDLAAAADRLVGKSTGLALSWQILIAVIGIAGMIIGFTRH